MSNGNECTLGVRAEARRIHWAIVDGSFEQPEVRAFGIETAPNAYSEAESLTWIRQQLIQIIEQYKPLRVGIRYPERSGFGEQRESTRARLRVEGVVLDTVNSKNLEVVTGALNTISKNLHCSAKDCLDSKKFRGLELSQFKEYVPEAILAASSVLSSS